MCRRNKHYSKTIPDATSAHENSISGDYMRDGVFQFYKQQQTEIVYVVNLNSAGGVEGQKHMWMEIQNNLMQVNGCGRKSNRFDKKKKIPSLASQV